MTSSVSTSLEEYPTPKYISDLDRNIAFVPKSLKLLLRQTFSENNADHKNASLGGAIMLAARLKVIAPLQTGLAVQMHHLFGSKFLIDSFNRHGFCASYTEVKKFETSAVVSQGTDI